MNPAIPSSLVCKDAAIAVEAGPIAILIPAYRPERALLNIVRGLVWGPQRSIVVVDDGSGPEYAALFEEIGCLPNVRVLHQPSNLGKGSALKRGIAFLLGEYPDLAGVVTADADGQHDPADVLNVCERFRKAPDALVMGARGFSGSVPARSKVGNLITLRVVRAVLGQKLSDSQTGLRAIPVSLLNRLLKAGGERYEFEIEMLIAAKHLGTRIVEQPIRTIYEPGNPTSHFRPLWDSMRIGYVLFRSSMIAIATAALDNLAFYVLYSATGSIAVSQALARAMAVCFNYPLIRKAVFLSDEPHGILLPRYLLLVAVNCGLSYAAIKAVTAVFPENVFTAKVAVETLLFLFNVIIQRDWIFRKRTVPSATDWDQYYQQVPFTARFTRRYTQRVLVSVIRRYAGRDRCPSIVELGGANSCFLDGILAHCSPRSYRVIDSNDFGLSLLRSRLQGKSNVTLYKGNVLALSEDHAPADCVFSIGLIEHFDREGTRQAIRSHFDLLREGGCAIISFPTPTGLYRFARSLAESFGMWKFFDERPLSREEVRTALNGMGDVLFEKTLWPLVLTQHLMVVRRPGPQKLNIS
jgi:glycosyltransferase involved in cell wall biosynthesis